MVVKFKTAYSFNTSCILAAGLLLGAGLSQTAWAQTVAAPVPSSPANASPENLALTPEQAKQIDTYLTQMRKSAKPMPSAAQATGTDAAPAAVAQAGQDGNEMVAVPDAKSVGDLLALAQSPAVPAGLTYGLSAGQGVQPAVPVSADLERQTAQAIIAAYQTPNGAAADQVALNADAAATDPLLEERISLAETVFQVDGTEDLIRHFVATEHMKLVIDEVARHIDFTKLSDTDKYRLAAIAAVAQTELEDKIIRMNALIQANNLSKPELMQLVVAYNIDAERKLTQMRLTDNGKEDDAADLDLHIAQYQIVKAYEAGE